MGLSTSLPRRLVKSRICRGVGVQRFGCSGERLGPQLAANAVFVHGLALPLSMSELGQTRTSRPRCRMSVSPPRAGHLPARLSCPLSAKGGSDPDSRRCETAIVRHTENDSVKPLPA